MVIVVVVPIIDGLVGLSFCQDSLGRFSTQSCCHIVSASVMELFSVILYLAHQKSSWWLMLYIVIWILKKVPTYQDT